jgi:hypothetical protein
MFYVLYSIVYGYFYFDIYCISIYLSKQIQIQVIRFIFGLFYAIYV